LWVKFRAAGVWTLHARNITLETELFLNRRFHKPGFGIGVAGIRFFPEPQEFVGPALNLEIPVEFSEFSKILAWRVLKWLRSLYTLISKKGLSG
jgi:hypothetical protein